MDSDTSLERLLTARELARELGVSTQRVYAYAREMDMPHVRLGRAVRFRAGDVESWMAQGGTAADASDD